MLLLLRKVFFYVLVLTYLILTPLTILYALGYILNPVEKAIVKTGLISIVTHPKDATVYVGGKKYAFKTPTIISDLLPGRYPLRIVHHGCQPWEKEIPIYPERATQLESVLLLPVQPKREFLTTKAFRGFLPLVADFKAFAWETESLGSLKKIDLLFKKASLVERAGQFQGKEDGGRILDFITKEGSKLVFFVTKGKLGQRYWALEPGWTTELREITPLVLKKPLYVDWNVHSTSYLYYFAEGDLYRANFHKGWVEPQLASGLLGFGVHGRKLFLLTQESDLLEADLRAKERKTLFNEERGTAENFRRVLEKIRDALDFYQIRIFERDLMIFLSRQGTLIANRRPYQYVEKGVRGIRLAKDSEDEKLLYWTDNEIGFLRFSESREPLVEQKGEKVLLYDKGERIRQAFWAYEDSHILFLDKDRVYLIEAKGPRPYYVRSVGSVAGGTLIEYVEREHSFYYLDPESRRLVKQRLIE